MDSTDLGRPTVVVDRVSKKFEVAVDSAPASSRIRRAVGRVRPRRRVIVHALRSVSFVAHAGESIGVVGTNGSGKSTLLSIIAGLNQPSRGQVMATSQPLLLGVGAALQANLSGMQNARLGLLAMGLSTADAETILPRVLELAGIGDAIYRPIQTYSSGMGARLRFAIAAAAEPEILLLDEVLSTGDAASNRRAQERMDEIRGRAGTVFLVSHAAQTIEETCSRALWLHEGALIKDGPAEQTARAYRLWAWKVATGEAEAAEILLQEAIDEFAESSEHDAEVLTALGGQDARA